MGVFWRKLCWFWLPLGALLVFPAWVLLRSGELAALDPAAVAAAQRETGRPALFGPAYSDCALAFKRAAALQSGARVMAVGTSRTMQFRAAFFREPDGFYNAGGAVSQLADYRRFLEDLPRAAQPDLLVVGLDQNFFNPDYVPDQAGDYDRRLGTCAKPLDVVLLNWTAIYAGVVGGRFDVPRLACGEGGDGGGLNALARGNGFRRDGSYRYGAALADPVGRGGDDAGFSTTLHLVETGRQRFVRGDRVWGVAVDDVRALLREASARGIRVVAFLPPYAPTVLDAMRRTGGYDYVERLPRELESTFREAGFPLLDFTDVRPLGATDDEFVDGFHGSERTAARMLGVMARADGGVSRAVDADALAVLLARAKHPFALVED